VKLFDGVYDFVAGRSIVAPIGLTLALLAGHFGSGVAPVMRATVFFGILLLTFLASTLERAR